MGDKDKEKEKDEGDGKKNLIENIVKDVGK